FRGHKEVRPTPLPNLVPWSFLLPAGPRDPERHVVEWFPRAGGGNCTPRARPPTPRLHAGNELVGQADGMALDVMGQARRPHHLADGQAEEAHPPRPRPAQPEATIGIPRVAGVGVSRAKVPQALPPLPPAPITPDQPAGIGEVAWRAPSIPVVSGAP